MAKRDLDVSELQYEPRVAARPVVVEHDAGVTRIIVPMQGLYAPVPTWMTGLDVLSLFLVPVWWIATLVARWSLGLPRPPRAAFEVSSERVTMTLRDRASGETSTFNWPRAAVVEARANRYGPGFWMNVTGHVKETYLPDLPPETIERLEAALSEALSSQLPPVPAEKSP